MRFGIVDGKPAIILEPDDPETLRYALGEALKEFVGYEEHPILDTLQRVLENGIESFLNGVPLFPKD
jgi:hypothetical protein